MKSSATAYILVRHSAWTAKNDPNFEHAVELRSITLTKSRQLKLEKHGVKIYESWSECDQAANDYCYPKGYKGLIPQAKGQFKNIAGITPYKEDIFIPAR